MEVQRERETEQNNERRFKVKRGGKEDVAAVYKV